MLFSHRNNELFMPAKQIYLIFGYYMGYYARFAFIIYFMRDGAATATNYFKFNNDSSDVI